MIAVTRLDGAEMLLNVDAICRVERTPDTLIALANGETLMVRETPDEIVERVIRFKHAVLEGRGGHQGGSA
jgi:flagellar protein FlbD